VYNTAVNRGSVPTTSRLLLAIMALGSTPSQAASFDPDLTWRTITTEHFHIHFHQGEEQLAEEFSHKVEDVYDSMTDELKWTPRRRTELVLIDRTDSANGFAMALPYNQIVVYVTAPTESSSLGFYEDWGSTIFTHELTHILHIDTNHGIVRLARSGVGRVASTNRLSPGWVVEGLGTFQETRHTTGGRGRAALADMILRTAALESDWPPLGNLDGFQAEPPAGNLRYLFGQDFMEYVSDNQGRDVWTKWTHTYGSWIPYWLPSERVFGERLVPLYFGWKDDRAAKYKAVADAVRAEGLIEGRLVSGGIASCYAPAFAPDGDKLVWSCADRRTGSAIWMADGHGYAPEVLLQDRGASSFTWRSDSKAFAYSGSHVVNRFNVWSDIYLHTLGKERPSALTKGARARDPEFTPDGSQLFVVTNRVQNNQLERLTVDKRRIALTENTDHTQYSTPRVAPDGQSMVVSVWNDGRRDLWLYDLDAKPLRRLTADASADRDPRWSKDGRWLYFSSDRSGIPNIYAIEMATERLFQISNVLTGALRPSIHPDGTRLAYQRYSFDGFDVRVIDLDPDKYIDRGLLPRDLLHDVALADIVTPVDTPVEMDETALLWRGDPVPAAKPMTSQPAAVAMDPFEPGRSPIDRLMMAAMPQDPDSLDSFDQSDVEGVFGEEEDYPFTITPHRYNPLPNLLPRYWLPWVQSTPAYFGRRRFTFLPGFAANAAAASTDPLRRFGWNAGATYRSDADFLGGFATLQLNRFLPVYSLSVSSRATPFIISAYPERDPNGLPGVYPDNQPTELDDDGNILPNALARPVYWEKRRSFAASVSYPYTARTTVFARYSLTERTALRPISAFALADTIPTRGTIGQISAGWRYSWSQQTTRSISREDGRIFSLVGAVLHPVLGTKVLADGGGLEDLRQIQVATELREYMVNPWIPNQVLAVRAAGGITVGDTARLGNYRLGGSFGDSAFYATPDGTRMLRGYPFGADLGDMYWLGGAEYRLPLWRVDRGVGTIPFFARYLSGLVFIDAGNAFITVNSLPEAFDGALVGTGAELKMSTAIGYRTGISGSVGWAAALTPGGYSALGDPLDNFYFRVGGSF